MKIKTAFISFSLVATLTAAIPVQAKDPCATVLCMAGMLTGNSGGSECSSAVSDYFSIVKFKKGKFKKSATKQARKEFLQQCTKEDEGWINQINSAYGTVRKGF
ncbi:TrbM/KikA/MpfK family conjugal transfer protein [Erwinia amylovora]|uniref:TrbM/KikA/MpfK family conjugal transfer protein n=1 Tax=Erwinia amylovora TaxID=552 RepID=UPI0022AB9565|nr:TrbM/KikA/MpfK family conjugal transfer protein [Erwinia amylovora]MCZ2719984.1 TrbM/KikA/MpfK family conjugal transfer protein [Erwinia amylovora]